MKNSLLKRGLFLLAVMLFLSPVRSFASALPERVEQAIDAFLQDCWGAGNVEWIPSTSNKSFKVDSYDLIKIREISNPRGRVVLFAELYKDKHMVKALPVRINVIAFDYVGVLKQDINRNSDVSISDISWEKREVTEIRSDWIKKDNTRLKNRCWTRKKLKQGEILLERDIEKRPEVVVGDQVMILAEKGNIQISVPGIARQNGKIGDIIKVVNSQYNKVIRAKVNDEATVVVL